MVCLYITRANGQEVSFLFSFTLIRRTSPEQPSEKSSYLLFAVVRKLIRMRVSADKLREREEGGGRVTKNCQRKEIYRIGHLVSCIFRRSVKKKNVTQRSVTFSEKWLELKYRRIPKSVRGRRNIAANCVPRRTYQSLFHNKDYSYSTFFM